MSELVEKVQFITCLDDIIQIIPSIKYARGGRGVVKLIASRLTWDYNK